MAIGYIHIKILDRTHRNVESRRYCQKAKSQLVRDLHISLYEPSGIKIIFYLRSKNVARRYCFISNTYIVAKR